MARRDPRPEVSRRKFLAGVAVAGAATAVTPPAANGATQATSPNAAPAPRPSALPPSMHVAAAETGTPKELSRIGGRARLRFHGRRHQDARHQVPAVEPGLQLPRHPRIADQLRRQQDAGIPHLHPRGIRGRHGARLFQDHRQAADDALPWHGRPAARGDGGLQRLVRSRAGHHRRRQRPRRRPPAAGRADDPLGAGHQRAGARLHQVGRYPGLAAALRAVVRARLQDRDDAALRTGRRSRSTPACSRSRCATTARSCTSRATWPARRRRAIPARCARPRGCWPMPSTR